MKRFLFVLPVVMGLMLASYAPAADPKPGEWNVSVGCAKCNFDKETSASSCGAAAKTADGKVVLLKGAAMKGIKFKKGGEFVVKGTMSEDSKSIEVTDIKPKA